jgi:transcriptional regulator GlxA family with amidase domain
MPISDITAACGFQSPPHFSKCYRSQFGYPPSEERKIEGRSTGGPAASIAAAVI